MRKIMAFISVLVLVLLVTACAKQTEAPQKETAATGDATADAVQNDLNDIDSLESDLNFEELDSLDEDLDFNT